MSRYVRLNKNGFIFRDQATGFTLQKGEVKPLPENIGNLTRMWLQAGGIELCSPPQTSAPSEAPIVVEEQVKPETKSIEDRVAELEACDIKTLRQMCIEKQIKFGYRSSKETLAQKIVDIEYGN